MGGRGRCKIFTRFCDEEHGYRTWNVYNPRLYIFAIIIYDLLPFFVRRWNPQLIKVLRFAVKKGMDSSFRAIKIIKVFLDESMKQLIFFMGNVRRMRTVLLNLPIKSNFTRIPALSWKRKHRTDWQYWISSWPLRFVICLTEDSRNQH